MSDCVCTPEGVTPKVTCLWHYGEQRRDQRRQARELQRAKRRQR